MGKALEGVHLVEFSSHLGAAYAAMILAEQGARAIKVEPPGSPGRGTPHFHVANRSKRSLLLDLEGAGAAVRAQVRELIGWADIVIAGHTPRRLTALGLDYESIRNVNPRAILVRMPPLGNRGPDSDDDANDTLVQARGGIAASQWARSGNPVPLTFPAASYSAALMAAAAATAALVARGGGAGQAVEVSLLAGAFSLQTGSIMQHQKMTALYARAAHDPLGPIPCYRLFEAADGRYLFIACGNATFWNKFLLAVDRADLAGDPRFEGAPWGIPPEHWQTLKDLLGGIIRTRPRDQWLRILREADVPCAPVQSRPEFIDDPQTRAMAMRREIDDPTLGPTVQMGVPVNLHDAPGEVAGPTPAMQTEPRSSSLEQLLASPMRRDSRSESPRVAGGPLAGVTVLDFASYIAGSYGPMILAQMGARVIKIESLEGDAFRHFGFGFLGWNQGKHGLALNLNAAEGREIVLALARQADIVVENLRPRRMARFGLDYQSLAALNPHLIYMSVTGFGNRGPEHDQPAFDPLLQARSGVMAAQGGHHRHPVYLTCAICDYGAAMLSALGCVLALRARQRTGRGQMCETSLLQAALALQAGEFVFYPGRPDLEDGDPEYRGASALSRCYRCRDNGWVAIAVAQSAHWDAMRVLLGGGAASLPYAEAAREPAEGRLSAAIGEYFAARDRAQAVAALQSALIPIAPVSRVRELFEDPQVAANELVAELDHPDWGRVKQTGILAKFSATPAAITRAAPTLGQHTDEILAGDLGYDRARIADLRARNIVR